MGTINPWALDSHGLEEIFCYEFLCETQVKEKKCAVFLLCNKYILRELKLVTDGVRIISWNNKLRPAEVIWLVKKYSVSNWQHWYLLSHSASQCRIVYIVSVPQSHNLWFRDPFLSWKVVNSKTKQKEDRGFHNHNLISLQFIAASYP